MAAIHLDRKGFIRGVRINRIASVHGRENINKMLVAADKAGTLLYYSKKKPLNVPARGLHTPTRGIDNRGFEKTILSQDDVVKLYQSTANGINGFIQITNDGKVGIKLTENANLSTFLHETGHFFLHVLSDLDNTANIGNDIKEISATLKKWLKADDLQSLTVKQHEKFARGFEAYLMEGKAPSLELQTAFAHFKAWLTQIYKVIRNLNVKLNDDVRRVFDRMLATDAAIEVARAPYKDVFSSAEQAGMSPKEFAAYQELAAKANEKAKQKLLNQSLKEISRERTKEWKEAKQAIKQEVITELQDNPIYVLDDFLRRGVDKNGQQLLDVQKLDAELIKSIYGEEVAEQLMRFTQKDGLHPDVVAEMFGFDSTDAMIQQLASKPSNQAMVNAETTARLTERFGDILLDGSMADKAILAMENEGRANVLVAELKAINKQNKLANRINC